MTLLYSYSYGVNIVVFTHNQIKSFILQLTHIFTLQIREMKPEMAYLFTPGEMFTFTLHLSIITCHYIGTYGVSIVNGTDKVTVASLICLGTCYDIELFPIHGVVHNLLYIPYSFQLVPWVLALKRCLMC